VSAGRAFCEGCSILIGARIVFRERSQRRDRQPLMLWLLVLVSSQGVGNMADDPLQPSYLYDAFISYRHVARDRKWAEWLIDALERYRAPFSLQQKGLPTRLRKVFRDEDEVPASSDLNDQILQALVASRFLIVVCSAFTPRSKWVQRQIQIFNELGRGDQILVLLTEGEPGDSFPEALLVRRREVVDSDGSKRIVEEDKEPLAADVRPRPRTATAA
jgi:hypothetical protein